MSFDPNAPSAELAGDNAGLAREIVEAVVSAANIVTCDGYYEVDADAATLAVAPLISALRTTQADNVPRSLLREALPHVEAMEMEGDLDIRDLLLRIDAALKAPTTEPKPAHCPRDTSEAEFAEAKASADEARSEGMQVGEIRDQLGPKFKHLAPLVAAEMIPALVEGLHAQVFGVHSLGDPEVSHAALADGGQIHEAVHALVRALPATPVDGIER